MVELALGGGYFSTVVGSFLMLVAVCFGGNIYTWRGTLLMCGIAVIFAFAGKFAPWRRFIRRVVDMDRVGQKWKAEGRPTVSDLSELIADGRRALAMKGPARAQECARVLPKLVTAVEFMAAKQVEINRVCRELSVAWGQLEAMVRARSQMTGALAVKIDALLDELEGMTRHD